MQGHIEVVELLLSKGVQLDALSFKGDNCLEAAVDENKRYNFPKCTVFLYLWASFN